MTEFARPWRFLRQQVLDEESSIKTVTQESELAPNRVAIRQIYDVPTRGVAKLLISPQAGTNEERTFVRRLGLIAARYGLSIATLTQSYLQWRDANLLVLGQEVNRLRTPPAIATEAMAIIRSVADSGWFERHGRTNVRWISIQWRRIPETAFWRLGVADIGIGCTDVGSELVFQRIVRIDPNDSRRSGGAGLGLAIARALVNMHGSQMAVESSVGLVSTFAVRYRHSSQ